MPTNQITELLPSLWAVKVPNESKGHIIIKAHSYMKDDPRLEHSLGGIDLPKGFKYTIIGLAQDVTEEVAADIIEGNNMGNHDTMWRDYTKPHFSFAVFHCSTTLESLQSLLRNKGCDTGTWILIKVQPLK